MDSKVVVLRRIAMIVAGLGMLGCTSDEPVATPAGELLGPEVSQSVEFDENDNFPFIVTPADTTVRPVLSRTFDGKSPGDEPEVVPLRVLVGPPAFPNLSIEDVEVAFSFDRAIAQPDTLNFTGGHDHPQPGDDLPARPRGRFLTDGISAADFEFRFFEDSDDSLLVVFPDATGEIVVPYRTSGIGGRERVIIVAQERSYVGYVAAPTVDTVPLTLRIGEFVELSEGPGIELVGETGSHPSNHWATSETIGYVETLAQRMSIFFPGIRLKVNDMNLEFGGIFDCAQPDTPGCPGLNPWGPPHRTHKVGIQVDFNLDNLPEPVRSDTARVLRDELDALPIDAKVYDEETSHHHATFCPATGEVDGFVITACQ